ncbi:hypothetical protein DMC30DRAFT_62457 [Rhodotorula diobovata]|uniref:Proteophosphoglycan ppg4 n=1 Tax=Rhodotorula diobovata TaxID=5288 RepID=A0A5C5FPT6_9BASI|nr:hypothetical protein DMC30DRAFT_62457 [Rhodotorula diobovata]
MARQALALLALAPAYFALGAPAPVTVTVPSTTRTAVETVETYIDLGPDYYVDEDYFRQEFGTVTVDGNYVVTPAPFVVEAVATTYTTPATSTVLDEAVSTSTPAAVKTTETITFPTQTVYQTEWKTITPPTSTVTSIVSASTGTAACVDYRLVFPADCCPSAYVKLSKFSRRQVDFIEDDEPVVNTPPPADDEEDEPLPDPVPIEAPPVEEPATVTVTSGEASTTQTVLTTLFEPRPEVPVSSIVYAYKGTTVTAATPTVSTTRTITQEAATPLVTVKTTRVILAEAPIQTERTTAPTPTTTVTVTSTSTLATPLATTTSTSYAQPTACVQKTVWTQKACPASVLVKNLVQDVQVTKLNLYKALGGKSVIVDCGRAGTFRY